MVYILVQESHSQVPQCATPFHLYLVEIRNELCLFIYALALSSLFTFPRAHLIVQDIVEEKMSFTPLDRHLVNFLFMQRCIVFAPH